jgi:hypothetical protein
LKNKNFTAQKSNSNTVWFKFQTYIILSINLVSQVTLRSSGTDILYGCHRPLYQNERYCLFRNLRETNKNIETLLSGNDEISINENSNIFNKVRALIY